VSSHSQLKNVEYNKQVMGDSYRRLVCPKIVDATNKHGENRRTQAGTQRGARNPKKGGNGCQIDGPSFMQQSHPLLN